MALVLKHQTKEQFMSRFRQRYRDSSGEQCAKLSSWLLDRIDDQDFTDEQVINAFNFKVSELIQFKTRMNTLRSSLRHIRSAIGE